MIQIRNVTKRYGSKKVALNNVSLAIPEKQTVVIAGVNGAGKSTLLKCISGLAPFEGEITIDGFLPDSVESKRKIAFCTEVPQIFDFLTLEEHIRYWAAALKIKDWQPRAEELYKRFRLEDYVKVLGKNMSKGIKQKTSLCCAFIRNEGYFILDEPMVGLDPYAIEELKNIINEKKDSGCTVILSTHILQSAQDIWDRMFVVDKGEIAHSAKRSESDGDIVKAFLKAGIKSGIKAEIKTA